MSRGKMKHGTRGRKPGDWKTIAYSRNRTTREPINGRGLSGFVKIGEIGSAAYRRLKIK